MTLTPGTLTVTHTEALTLTDGTDDHGVGVTSTFAIGSIARVSKRIVSVSSSETGLVSFATTNATPVAATAFASGYAAGHYDEDSVRYLRITNLDSTDHVELTFRNASSDEFKVILEFGQSFIYSALGDNGLAATMSATDAGAAGALATIADITAVANTGSVELEVYIASV